MNIADLRREYVYAGLSRSELDEDPFAQFEKWFQQASDAKVEQPNAMSLATAGGDGMPSLRTVLLKYFDRQGFVFYTNYGSHKARDLEANPQAALLFPWLELDRQVKIQGPVEKISAAESLKYFTSRPRGSQIGAWCSHQSRVVSSRSMLEAKFQEVKERFGDGAIPLPSFWGGYRVVPRMIEFWQGRENRLHDRFRFDLAADGDWNIRRLAP
ncbi:MAG: pyridoxamine 5'-phosphate oxidase [Gammaproteobacteria bacterium]